MLLKRPKLSRKEVKILEYGLKISLSARPDSRTTKKGVQNAFEHESAFGVQKYHLALLECQTALSKCRMAPFWALAQLSSGANKAHPFRLFRRKMCPNSHSTHSSLFFKHSSLYKWGLDLKIQHSLLRSKGGTLSHTLKFLIFLIPILIFSQARGFRFQR